MHSAQDSAVHRHIAIAQSVSKMESGTTKTLFYILLVSHLVMTQEPTPENSSDKESERAATANEIKEELREYSSSDSIDFFSDLLEDKVFTTTAFKLVIPKRRKECIYQAADKHTELKFEFECVSSPTFTSDAKVSASIERLEGSEHAYSIVKEIAKRRRGAYDFKVETPGTYRFCLDNTDSSERKFIQLAVEVWKLLEVPKFHLENHMYNNNSMYNIYDELFRIHKGVSLMNSALMHTSSLAKYDASMLLSNLSMVNRFSIFSVLLIVGVCLLQLHLVKKMFGDSNRMGA